MDKKRYYGKYTDAKLLPKDEKTEKNEKTDDEKKSNDEPADSKKTITM